MWECKVVFQPDPDRPMRTTDMTIHARSFTGMWNRVYDIMEKYHAPVVGIELHRWKISQIHQGRAIQHVD